MMNNAFLKSSVIKVARSMGLDRKVVFNDLATVRPDKRKPKSKTLNFYSAANNIGNYLPVLAIHQKLGEPLDCWNAHDRNIDFDFINRNYSSVIIGGAGLLHPSFKPFWESFSRKNKLPFIIWGVGSCFPDRMPLIGNVKGEGCFGKDVLDAFKNADLVNIRDEYTAELVARSDASVTACPTLILLKDFRPKKIIRNSGGVLYAPHSGLLTDVERLEMTDRVSKRFENLFITENEQTARCGLWDLIAQYSSSRLVVTSRLHGAITAWSLGVPFLVLSRDKKIDGFARLAGIENIVYRDFDALIANVDDVPIFDTNECHRDAVKFADQAASWALEVN